MAFDETKQAVPATDVPHTLGWAAYLGVSWTWVIGMFLPVLLIRDFGVAGWFVFAVPNVLGAAAMGWSIRSREHSVRLVEQHRGATRGFSYVTIAFHLFFLVWMVSQLAGATVAAIAVGLALTVMLPLLETGLRQTTLAIGTLGASVMIAALAAGEGGLGWPAAPGRETSFDLVALACVCVLGFLTCPYLDLTFHHARQACRTPAESKLAFGIGFGAAFCSMIVFTLLYASGLASDRALRTLVGVHVAIQAIFTVGVHASSLAAVASAEGRPSALRFWLTAIVAMAIGLAARAIDAGGLQIGGMAGGEAIYRLFMSYYGLFAPAYVWLCVYPGRGFVRPHRRELQLTWLAVAIAAPFFTVGFFCGAMSWALAGVAIIVGARFLLDYARRDPLAEQRAEMLSRTADRQ